MNLENKKGYTFCFGMDGNILKAYIVPVEKFNQHFRKKYNIGMEWRKPFDNLEDVKSTIESFYYDELIIIE